MLDKAGNLSGPVQIDNSAIDNARIERIIKSSEIPATIVWPCGDCILLAT